MLKRVSEIKKKLPTALLKGLESPTTTPHDGRSCKFMPVARVYAFSYVGNWGLFSTCISLLYYIFCSINTSPLVIYQFLC